MSRVACGCGWNVQGEATTPEARISGHNWEHEELPYERWTIGVAKDAVGRIVQTLLDVTGI